MGKLLDWVKANAKEGANLAEFEDMEKATALPDSKEKAWDFMQKNPAFKSALDAEISRATAAHDERFKGEKLPAIEKELREKLTKELHPEETKEQKELREIREELAREKAERTLEARRSTLIKKATEKGFDPEIAGSLAVLGEEADKTLDALLGKYELAVNAKYEKTAREKLGGENTPPAGGESFDLGKAMPSFLG